MQIDKWLFPDSGTRGLRYPKVCNFVLYCTVLYDKLHAYGNRWNWCAGPRDTNK